MESLAFFLIAEFSSDAQHVASETLELRDLLREQQDPRRRRLVARAMVLNLQFLAEATSELYSMADKVVREYQEAQKVSGIADKQHFPHPAREGRKTANRIARLLKAARNTIAHPYRVRNKLGRDNPIHLVQLTEVESLTSDTQTLELALDALLICISDIQTWFGKGRRLGIR